MESLKKRKFQVKKKMKNDCDENAINNKRNQEEYEEIKINNEND